MTTITITSLPLQGTVQDATLIPVETTGTTGHITASSLKTYISAATLTGITAGTGTFSGIVSAGSLYTNDIHASSLITTGDVTVGGALNFTASSFAISSMNSSGNITLTGAGYLIPSSNATAALGSPTYWLNNSYVVTSTVGSLTATTATATTVTAGALTATSNASVNIGGATNWFNNLYAVNATLGQVTTNAGGLQTGANLVSSIGSSSTWFNNLYTATATVKQINVNDGGIQPGANLIANIGSSTMWFNNIYGVASHALYADLAEKYESDSEYAPGTVVVFGDATEVTISTTANDARVAGVVSTNPAYLMNEGAPGVAVALQGRVPCQVIGDVKRGDLMVTSNHPGVAMACTNPQVGTVIGKALGSYSGIEVGIIEVVVGRI
jgi:hypothetical protein